MSRDKEISKEERTNKERGNTKSSQDSNIVGKELYTNISINGKENKVKIIPEEMIWFGSYGNIYKICIEYPDWRKFYFAQKVFKKSAFLWNGSIPDVELKNHIQQTLQTHKHLKKIKLPVWNTLRKLPDQQSIIMSLWSYGDKKILSTNKSKDRADVEQDTIYINTDDIIKQLYSIRSIATQHHIELSRDAFVIQYDTHTKESKILIGDYDAVQVNDNPSNGDTNKFAITQFLQKFMGKYPNIEKDNREELKKSVESFGL